jgi:TonB family protein
MNKPMRQTPLMVSLFAGLVFLATILHGSMSPRAQGIRTAAMDETPRGISLYQQGQNEEAIKVLSDVAKRYDDLRAWHYLGLALEKKGKTSDARKAHEKAAKLGDKLVDRQMDQVRNSEDFYKSLTPIRSELAEAGRSAQKYIELNPKLSRSKQEEWRARAESLLGFAEMANADSATQNVFSPKQVDVRAIILSKPEARYTEEARKRGVTGVVVLRVILAANGAVIAYPIKTLPEGLTAQALRAARQIKFVTAMKDGKPVSMVVQVEYFFNLY